jgi:hypothetical protein
MKERIMEIEAGTPKAKTPSAMIAQLKAVDITDATGRLITVRKPPPLSNLDFAKATGGQTLNVDYLMTVFHLKFVGAIDGVPVPTPKTESELRALYLRLGDEGNDAVQEAVQANFMPKDEDETELKNS